jgi:hypothetical protein
LLLLILTCKKWISDVKFVEDATEGPHVDGWCIFNTHHNFRSSVKSGLNVSVKLFFLIGAATEVNNLNATLVALAQQDVFGLHVTVNDAMLFDVMERDENLNSESAYETLRYSLEIVHFYEFIKVHRQNFEGQDQMFPKNQNSGFD